MRFSSTFFLLFISLAAAVFVVSCAPAQLGQNKNTPVIIAMGDMHGDFDVYEDLMLSADLMDAKGDWRGGDTIFIQTGDIPDRGPDTRKIIDSLQHLEKQAPNSGGQVIPLVGNHEAMNMMGDLRYVHSGEFAAFADENSMREKDNPLRKAEHQLAWSPDGYIGDWVSANQLVVKVQGYLFAHGGFSLEYTDMTLDEINAAGQEALRQQDWRKKSILRDNLGPLWYRGNVRGRDKENAFSREDEIVKVLATYNATHIIIGHTRNEKGIRASASGRVIQIDTGASAHYGGVPSFLRIENGEMFAHTLQGYTKLN